MPVSPYIASLRRAVGHATLLLPAVTVLPLDDDGRVLLVRQSDTGRWATIGGAVELDEDPASAAVRETAEETGVEVELTGILAALGGPALRVRYPNGDECAYVTTVYGARVRSGTPRPDGDETTEVAWFSPADLAGVPLDGVTTALLAGAGLWPGPPTAADPATTDPATTDPATTGDRR